MRNTTVQLAAAPARSCSSDSAPLQSGVYTPGLLDAATSLTRLSLQSVGLCGNAGQQLAALAVLTDLQDLSLSLKVPQHAAAGVAVLLPDSFLEKLGGLTKLTQLQLTASVKSLWSAAGMQHVSRLTRLRSLSLTSERRQGAHQVPVLFPEAATMLQCLTALTTLKLDFGWPYMHAGMLQCMSPLSALQQFVLRGCRDWDPMVDPWMQQHTQHSQRAQTCSPYAW